MACVQKTAKTSRRRSGSCRRGTVRARQTMTTRRAAVCWCRSMARRPAGARAAPPSRSSGMLRMSSGCGRSPARSPCRACVLPSLNAWDPLHSGGGPRCCASGCTQADARAVHRAAGSVAPAEQDPFHSRDTSLLGMLATCFILVLPGGCLGGGHATLLLGHGRSCRASMHAMRAERGATVCWRQSGPRVVQDEDLLTDDDEEPQLPAPQPAAAGTAAKRSRANRDGDDDGARAALLVTPSMPSTAGRKRACIQRVSRPCAAGVRPRAGPSRGRRPVAGVPSRAAASACAAIFDICMDFNSRSVHEWRRVAPQVQALCCVLGWLDAVTHSTRPVCTRHVLLPAHDACMPACTHRLHAC